MPGPLLFVLYLAVGLAPLALAWLQGLPPRPLADEVSSALALMAFSLLLAEFVISGRFGWVSGRIGIDVTMRFHQLVARPLTVLVLLHPFVYTLPVRPARPWETAQAASLGLDGASLLTGIAAWLLLALLVVAAICRDRIPYRYEAWRLSHGLAALLMAGAGTHHAVSAGRYSGDRVLGWFWLAMLALAAATLLVVYVVRPLLQLRHPYRIAAVRPVGLKTWEVALEPVRGEVLGFRAGQFVWLTADRSPFAIREHPFSIASAPATRGRVAFVIKEAGDFTNRVGELPVGGPAYLDGPYGNMVLPDGPAKGVCFLAGGVGIAPILSMLREAAARGERRPMKLVFGNRLREQIVYGDELESMTRTLDLEIVHVLQEPPPGWQGEEGLLDEGLVRRHCGGEGRAEWLHVVCGPPVMIDSVTAALRAMGVPPRRILSEKFSYS